MQSTLSARHTRVSTERTKMRKAYPGTRTSRKGQVVLVLWARHCARSVSVK